MKDNLSMRYVEQKLTIGKSMQLFARYVYLFVIYGVMVGHFFIQTGV